MDRDSLISKASKNKRESRYVDFKERVDLDSKGDWCELLKDIVAMANSEGGIVVFGVKNDGTSARFSAQHVLEYDPAKITDKVAKYTGRQFSDFELVEVRRGRRSKAALMIGSAGIPMVFLMAGTYQRDGKEKVAFQDGTIYFRHGAKSQPAVEEDLRRVIAAQVERARREWFEGVRKVMESPAGSVVYVESPTEASAKGRAGAARLVGDESAPPVRLVDGDERYPYRQKDVLSLVNQVVSGRRVTTFDILVIRVVYSLEERRPEFVYRPFENSSAQYSQGFVDWLLSEWQKDEEFFDKARKAYKESR